MLETEGAAAKSVGDGPTGPDPIQTIEISLPGSGPPLSEKYHTTRITWDFTPQHTIKWDQPITVMKWDDTLKSEVAVTIKPGSMNLYTFPKVVWAKPAPPKGQGLAALSARRRRPTRSRLRCSRAPTWRC